MAQHFSMADANGLMLDPGFGLGFRAAPPYTFAGLFRTGFLDCLGGVRCLL